jgi:imidazole glycerol-phosphate synthase subunit HisF
MKKKRIIFKLIFSDGYFCVSRNFKLQKVGNVDWLFDKLKFANIAKYIDELVIINASSSNFKDPISGNFKDCVIKLMEKTFVPLTIGGGLRNLSQVLECFKIGADKIILNSSLKDNNLFVKTCVNKFGSQAVIAGVDFKKNGTKFYSYTNNGQNKFCEIKKHLSIIKRLKCGEIFLGSIDKDGTGFGFENDILKEYNFKIPLVLSGGAGNSAHFINVISDDKISGLMTGNLFNFLGDGLSNLRKKMLKKSVNLRVI